VKLFFEPLIGDEAIAVLATFAFGGDRGLSMSDVAQCLDLHITKVRNTVAALAAAGVMEEVNSEYLSVRPRRLRHALVRNIYFSGPTSLDPSLILNRVKYLEECATTLIGAKGVGGSVPDEILVPIIESCGSPEIWRDYCWLGKEEVDMALDKCRVGIGDVADPSLFYQPEKAIPLLLDEAVRESSRVTYGAEDPPRLIDDWIKTLRIRKGERCRRREILQNSVFAWA